MVYDVSNRKTFDAVNIWMRMIQEQADSSVALILVGNKCDLPADQRQVSDDEGQALAEKFGIPFQATSAKNNTGVDAAFLNVATKVMEMPRSPRGAVALNPAEDSPTGSWRGGGGGSGGLIRRRGRGGRCC
jgi:GTPase SAR1 family protein